MKKNRIVITLSVFFAFLLFSCGKAPNTVKVLRSMNNAAANYWLDLVQKNGVNYVDYDGESIIAIALEAKNATLLQAVIKDGADLSRKYKNSQGVEKYPLEFVILATEQYYNQFAEWELAEILVNAGTKLQYPEGLDILLQAWRYGNTELIDLLLPGFKKQRLLDYSNFENAESLRIVISDALYLGWIPIDEKDRDENMIARFNKLAEAGVKLPKGVVEDFIMRFTSPPKNRVAVECLLQMAGMGASDLDAILSRKKVIYVPVVERIGFYQKPTGDYYDLIQSIERSGYYRDDDGNLRHSVRFELLVLGETFTDREGEAQWLYVKRSGGTNGWIISRYVREEEKLNFVATDNVRVRADPYVTADLRDTLPEGTEVILFRIERTDTIDGITAPWFCVLYNEGESMGYIFSGFLHEVEK